MLYNISTRQHFVSRDVKFWNREFPGLGNGRHLDSGDVLDIFNLSKAFDVCWDSSLVPTPAPSPANEAEPVPDETPARSQTPEPVRGVQTLPGDYPESDTSRFNETTVYEDILTTPDIPRNLPSVPTAPYPATRVLREPIQAPVPVRAMTRSQSKDGSLLAKPIRRDRGGVVQEDFFAFSHIMELDNEVVCASIELDMFHNVELSPDEFDGCLARVLDDPDWPENLTPEELPKTFKEAIRHPELGKFYKAACDEQYAALMAHKVWKLVPLPKNRVAIRGHWVVAAKVNSRSNWVTGIKSRWVADGNMQKAGIDYKETFSPTPKAATIRLVLAIAAQLGFAVRQADAINAFLHSEMDKNEEVYVMQPTGYHIGGPDIVCLLQQALWGICQAPFRYFCKAAKVLLELGFLQCKGDECLYYCFRAGSIVLCVVYVDDHIIAATRPNCDYYFGEIDKLIKLDDRGYLDESGNTVLGMNCTQRSDGSICLSQQGYIQRLLTKYDPDQSLRHAHTPLVSWKSDDWHNTDSPCIDKTRYLEAVGTVIYLSCSTRPDIAFCVGLLARFSQDPKEIHWQAFIRLIRYLKHTQSFFL